MIVGIGVDVVALPRIERMLGRWADRVLARVMTDGERAALPEGQRRIEYVAGRIAAKEATSKALGVPEGIAWHDVEVIAARPLPPSLRMTGVAHQHAARLGVSHVHLAITHDGGVAVAMVVLESDAPVRRDDGR